MYICPNCKTDLIGSSCVKCGFEIIIKDYSIPAFFTGSKISNRYEEIGSFYDNLYEKTEDSWRKLASRGPEFVKFIASIVAKNPPDIFLDIGCGEGYLLEQIAAKKKYGLDISHKALQVTKRRSDLEVCIGFSEQLPYRSDYFDTITSIGVMTHFIDDVAATKEINRVLKPGGYYVVGIFLHASIYEKILTKISEFTHSKSKYQKLIDWIINKGKRFFTTITRIKSTQRKDYQPIERFYTHNEVLSIFKISGFILKDLITKRKKPSSPLAGSHFRIYILQK